MRHASLLVLLLAASCCGSPRPCATVAAGEAPANELPVQAAPEAQAEPKRRWELGRPVDTHVASWDCAMPGPGFEYLALERRDQETTHIGWVRSVPDAAGRFVFTIDSNAPDTPQGRASVWSEERCLAAARILKREGSHGVARVVLAFDDWVSASDEEAWTQVEVRTRPKR